jgi:hypothetical protein
MLKFLAGCHYNEELAATRKEIFLKKNFKKG